MSARRLLMIDADAPLRALLREQLTQQGVAVDEAATAAEGYAMAVEGGYDLILLDFGLPDEDGGMLCRRLRAGGLRAPVILLTGSDSTAAGDAGATEAVAKPFRLGLLLARLRAHLERRDAVAVGPWAFDPAARLLVDPAGRTVRLTDKEAAILDFLQRSRTVVPREVLLAEVWGYAAAVDTHTLETHIYRLRQKIEADPADARIIVTEGGGYRLAG